MSESVSVIGAGLAGCECAWQLARHGISVRLIEMKPAKMTAAHVSPNFSELCCSNSLRSDELTNAVGLLKEELRRFSSLIMSAADKHRVAAGGALAVDREAFAAEVTDRIRASANIEIIESEASEIPEGEVIIASGPRTSDAWAEAISQQLGGGSFLSFYDAAAPLIAFDSIDMDAAYFASRYGKGTADYINCPMTHEEYSAFRAELSCAAEAKIHGFEDRAVFEACLPVEVLSRRGEDTLRFGPLKPVGLVNPRTNSEDYAVVQLRRDNKYGTIYNIVGFQTHLTFPEQRRVFSMIPALKNAEFVRYGVMHRNTYIDSPKLLDSYYRLRTDKRISFAGQITGVEGYVESCASGLLVGLETARRLNGEPPLDLPPETAIGALAQHISSYAMGDFQPMNINFGIMPPLPYRVKGKRNKNLELTKRSLQIIEERLAAWKG